MIQFKNKKILCFGEILWDMLPTGAKPGGAPLNVAAHLVKMDQDVLFISKVGKDKDGEKLIRFVKSVGIKSDLIQIDENFPTSKVLIKLDEQNNATYEICQPVAWDNIGIGQNEIEVSKKSGLIIFGTLASRSELSRSALMELLESDAKKLIDVNLRPPFDQQEIVEKLLFEADIAKLNDDELWQISGWHNHKGGEKQLIAWMANHFGLNMVCVTRGANGAILYHEGKFYEHPGFKVKPVDTVGAGDAFLAGLVSSFMVNHSPQKSLEFACAIGAFVATKEGATPKYKIEDVLKVTEKDS